MSCEINFINPLPGTLFQNDSDPSLSPEVALKQRRQRQLAFTATHVQERGIGEDMLTTAEKEVEDEVGQVVRDRRVRCVVGEASRFEKLRRKAAKGMQWERDRQREREERESVPAQLINE